MLLPYFLLSTLIFTLSCKKTTGSNSENEDTTDFTLDTLKVVSLYGPTSYFNYRGEEMGIDYENAKKFAADNGLELDFTIVENISRLIDKLENGEAHLAAYPVPSIGEYNSEIIYCGPKEITHQVLVANSSGNVLKDVTDLVGKNITVEKDSKYLYRLRNLNEELGGGINILTLESDTITTEDLLGMVASGKIDYTVADTGMARLYSNSFPNLDMSLRLSSDQAASWAVAPGMESLAEKINNWETSSKSSEFMREIYKRYYDVSYSDKFDATLSYFRNINLMKGGKVSDYDDIFRKYASTAGFDWRFLAAIAYCESRYNPGVESRFGAKGLMQVMPGTARAMGVDPALLGSPDINVLAAARIIAKLNESFKEKVEDPHERMKFVMAAYNAGSGHVYDSMALAEKLGLDPGKWIGNVSVAALMKSRPEYYNDPVVKHGYFRGRETVDFVDHVSGIYNYLMEKGG